MKLFQIRKRVAVAACVIIGSYVAALSLTNSWAETAIARYQNAAADAQIITAAYNQDKLLSEASRSLVEGYHFKGNSFASQLLMATAEHQGDLARRDRVLLEALRQAGNVEAFALLGESAIYDSAQRAQTLEFARTMENNKSLHKAIVASATTTLTEAQQQALLWCNQVLNTRYHGILAKAYYAYDLMYRPQSCDIPLS
ncbi:hypothetical protein [Pseudomonas amygdali]|uniref:Methyl-accepting chemotaxis protein n=2 Tax=Pseudomonas amygdali pv. lachrymans TaxID=53707 RepID=A0ABR5KST2_PSEAV|nr:hypothetical protein [Pseudomonas amygdali]AXH60307.1 hypothetical protein PLA107_034565 [Pseudomonas amygdali pv. lachrymans str. M301315]KPC17695.1 Uncharacterized protein AC499_0897 [Pseudomonas amygdali pv. lachrymans]RMT05835.1 hypothetical protein ALP54_04122 [Pseudomonas amygdali pv. lachrymans]